MGVLGSVVGSKHSSAGGTTLATSAAQRVSSLRDSTFPFIAQPSTSEAVTKLRVRDDVCNVVFCHVYELWSTVLVQCKGGSELFSTEQIHHPLEIVGDAGERDFRRSTLQTAQQKARISKDAVLQKGEGMLDRASA